MNRPLALIEGDLAIPKPRPFDGLPPPFGSRRRAARQATRDAARQTSQQMSQQAPLGTARPPRSSPFPPGVKHILFYKAPPQRVDSRFDTAMAEAKGYLDREAAKVRPRSSRSDHVLGASIFVGCGIALAWLLATCAMKDAEKSKPVLVAPTVLADARPLVDHPESVAKPTVADKPVEEVAAQKPAAPTTAEVAKAVPTIPAAADAPMVAQVTPLSSAQPRGSAQSAAASAAVPRQIDRAASLSYAVPKRAVRVIAGDSDTVKPAEKTTKRVKMARLSEAHVNERVALNRATRPAMQPAPSRQPEWAASASRSHDDALSDDASWLNWAAQQRRPSPTMRATAPVDNNWNEHMTQRRITDNPGAFHTDRGGQ
ncbi:hypothetical protein [Paraburkholderia domus]|uniref:hypothetical protein n=1 Tax=Paraburkholderia domus TaxID=2793075 RepID=UPI001B182D6C|nr:hypothetical protein [Paraburkholderia domus]CAE6739483.1 hypothetical protein R75483_02596 [Paraburkholderia domus]